MRVEMSLAWAGIRHRPARWLLLVLGVAVATALPVIAAGLRTEASIAAVRSAVETLPPASRAAAAITSRDLRGDDLAAVDRTVTDGFTAAQLTSPVRALTYKPLAVSGQDVTLGALDDLGQAVRITSGRAPASCTPTRCEVLSVRAPGSDKAVPSRLDGALRDELGVVVTGTGELVDRRVIGVGLVPADVPLLLTDAPDRLAELDKLSLFGRIRAWYGTLDAAAISRQGADRFGATLAGIADRVNVQTGPVSISWPVEEVDAAVARANAAAARFTVLGAGAAVLQLGFCLVVAAGLRPRQQLVGRLLTRRGARTGQLLLVALLQPLAAVPLGVVLGLVGGGLVVLRRVSALAASSRAGAGWAALASALAGTWPVLLSVAVAAVVLIVAVGRWSADRARGARTLLAAALVPTLALPVLILTTSASTDSYLSGIAISALLVAAGVVAALVFAPLLHRLSGRRGAWHPVRTTALLGAHRRPLLWMITAGFLAASCCSLIFTAGFRQSLRGSAGDQAAARVPLDVSVRTSARVAAPLAAVDVARLRQISPGLTVHPVVSAPVTAFAGTARVSVVPLVGVDLDTVPQWHSYAAVTGADVAAAELAGRLATPDSSDPVGRALPEGSRTLSLTVRGANSDIVVSLWLSAADGTQRAVELTGNGSTLRGAVPAGQGWRVQAVEVTESDSFVTHRQHGVGEGNTDRPYAEGDLVLGTPAADGTPLALDWSGWGSDTATVARADGSELAFHYRVADRRVVVAPDYVPPRHRQPIAVAVDPGTAARAGGPTIGITVNQTTLTARIVAVLPRLPSVGPAYLLADRGAVTALLNRTAPGTSTPNQVWLSVPAGELDAVRTELQSSPAAAATLLIREDLLRAVAEDPVATRSLTLLTIAGTIALALAMVAAATAVRADVDQSAADSYALELDGSTPSRLREIAGLRAALAIGVGVPLGVLGGIGLTAVAVKVLVTGPGGAPVVPPLRLSLAAGPTALVVVAALAGAFVASALVATAAHREPRPSEPELDLR